ncbi:MAG: Rieske 2Fe-2S domain-containing protein [Dehalococcoidales bacterium]|nr:Rieske 2Fe-2S domain-containing protein [Dehalococcoidales bacterium]
MGTIVTLGKVGELADGAMKRVSIANREILLARVGEKYYATDSICAHMGGDLSRGKLEGTIVTCPRHGSQYDITDGHNVRWLTGKGFVSALARFVKPPRGIISYPVNIENGNILIEV